MADKIDQSGASAGGDVVAGNKFVTTFVPVLKPGVVEKLLERLHVEIAQDTRAQETKEMLKFFYTRRTPSGPGLEGKLQAAGRTYEIEAALEKKELFAKLLERWSLYGAAQEILIHLLARAEHEFSMSVAPHLGDADHSSINNIITSRIVDPTVADCGADVMAFNHSTAMGMVYWLAEQCFVRWHK